MPLPPTMLSSFHSNNLHLHLPHHKSIHSTIPLDQQSNTHYRPLLPPLLFIVLFCVQQQSDIVDMAHTAFGQLEALKKKELLLSAMTMPKDEFEKMCADRKKLIVESSSLTDTVAPPLPLLIGNSANNTTVDTLDNEGQVMVDEGAI